MAKFEFEYEIRGTATFEAEDKEAAQCELEAEVDWHVDDLPGKKDWWITGASDGE